LPGDWLELQDGDRKVTIFVPSKYWPAKAIRLAIHFHGATWHAVQEHLDRGSTDPILACHAGEGSSVYAKLFEDKERLGRWLRLVEAECIKRGAPKDAAVSCLAISSFSAGYGAVRQIVQDPIAFRLIHRVVLCDSIYGSLDTHAEKRTPAFEHIGCWKALAEAAIRGEKTFCVTFSQVPTPDCASTAECAAALVRLFQGQIQPVEKGTLVATIDRDYPLLSRFDKGRFHVWGYGGDDAQAHMTHASHLAEVWKALDLVKSP